MSVKENLEEKIQGTEKKLKEFSISMKRLDGELQRLLEELKLTPEQLKNFSENSEYFTPPVWEYLQNEKKQMDENLNLAIACVSDPLKKKKSYSERGNVQQHWLFVR